MRKFLFMALLIPVFAFSQNAKPKDSITIPVPVAKKIAKDLVSLDSTVAELKLAQEKIQLLEKKISLKDSITVILEAKSTIYEEAIHNEKSKFELQGTWVKDLQRENKKLKIKLIYTKVSFTAIIGGLVYFLAK